MTYEIYINDSFCCCLYTIVDIVNYVNNNNLTILNESEFTDYDLIKIYCEEV